MGTWPLLHQAIDARRNALILPPPSCLGLRQLLARGAQRRMHPLQRGSARARVVKCLGVGDCSPELRSSVLLRFPEFEVWFKFEYVFRKVREVRLLEAPARKLELPHNARPVRRLVSHDFRCLRDQCFRLREAHRTIDLAKVDEFGVEILAPRLLVCRTSLLQQIAYRDDCRKTKGISCRVIDVCQPQCPLKL